MELSLQKLENEIKEIRCERDKALQELARLKQHLLEKVACSPKSSLCCIKLLSFKLQHPNLKIFILYNHLGI